MHTWYSVLYEINIQKTCFQIYKKPRHTGTIRQCSTVGIVWYFEQPQLLDGKLGHASLENICSASHVVPLVRERGPIFILMLALSNV